jgi:hypothetical protein
MKTFLVLNSPIVSAKLYLTQADSASKQDMLYSNNSSQLWWWRKAKGRSSDRLVSNSTMTINHLFNKIYRLNFWLERAWWLHQLSIKMHQIEMFTFLHQSKFGTVSKLIQTQVKCKKETLKIIEVEGQKKLIIFCPPHLHLFWEEDTHLWQINQARELLSLTVNSIYFLLWKKANHSPKF